MEGDRRLWIRIGGRSRKGFEEELIGIGGGA